MKAISLKQPWASWVAEGRKTIETRTWRTRHRGDILIVASKKPKIDELPTGQALCVANLVECRQMKKADESAAICRWEPGRFAWLLTDIRPVEPFAVKGMLGVYEVDDILVEFAMDCRNCNGISSGCEIDGCCITVSKAG